eukprot:g2803.t1
MSARHLPETGTKSGGAAGDLGGVMEDPMLVLTTHAKAIEALEDNEAREVIFVLSPEQAREKLLFQVRASEEVEDYDAMRSYVVELVRTGCALDKEERRMLLVAFKNSVAKRRAAWRKLIQLENAMDNTDSLLPHLRIYRGVVEDELEVICREIIETTDILLVGAKDGELDAYEGMFYFKLRGDYWRYLCEVRKGLALDESKDRAKDEYAHALSKAKGPLGLTPSDPQVLGLALNMSVFYYEILGMHREGRDICIQALVDAESDLSGADLDLPEVKDALDVMRLLNDNLNLWENDAKD